MSVLLASPLDVLSRIGSQSGDEQIMAMQSCLDAANVLIEEILDTQLTKGTSQDYFDFVPLDYSDPKNMQTLRLQHGFITGDVLVFRSIDGTAIADDIDDAEAIASTEYVVDRLRGVVSLNASPYPSLRSVAVRYVHGFSPTDTVPAFLKEAAIAGAIAINQAHNNGFRNAKVRDNAPTARRILQQMVQNKTRPRFGTWCSDSVAITE